MRALKKKAQDVPPQRRLGLIVLVGRLALASSAIYVWITHGVVTLPVALLKGAVFVSGVVGIGVDEALLWVAVGVAIVATVVLACTKGPLALMDMQPKEEPVLRSWREVVRRAYSALCRRPPQG
ncbi:hypothetical protein [Deinococcus xianganensis]|uniref:Uncharacterized protein n=1 Tax=Deinococcus xianganensis TaxID=1507289 RepID=A0A6I4YN52_9DEIO|nr:hypothetical protein [Deinococcus xianganensis]MXV21234.1 hypothetical protein [Deinococcus xianganensis]